MKWNFYIKFLKFTFWFNEFRNYQKKDSLACKENFSFL